MTQLFTVHPENPQARLLRQAAHIIKLGGLVVYPTDSGYAMGCRLGNKTALERIQRIRLLDKTHYLTLVCRDLSELGTYAKVNNRVFRLLKAFTPGAYTFVLNATNEVPRKMLNPKRKTLGLRIPNHPITQSLLDELEEPLMSTTLLLPHHEVPLSESGAIKDLLGKQVDLIIDGGQCASKPTTVVDLTEDQPKVLRVGEADPSPFE